MDNTNDKNSSSATNGDQKISDISADDLQSLAQSYAQDNSVDIDTSKNDTDVSSLQKEIEDQLSRGVVQDQQPSSEGSSSAPHSSEEDLPVQDSSGPINLDEEVPAEDFPFPSVASKREPVTDGQPIVQTSLADIENPGITSDATMVEAKEPEVQKIEDLEKDIAEQFNQNQGDGSFEQPLSNKEGEKQSQLGIGDTYYTDISNAMSSSEPQTMSELLRQSAYEEKEEAALSPTSKKNLMYIVGTLLFLVVSVVSWFFVFGGSEDQPEFITKERVNSLVFSDKDLGINTTGLQTFQAKSAIRGVVERDHTSDSVSQIYYVQEDTLGNLRRIGIKDVFDRTESEVPTLLYDNIENEFMHGVHTSDKNYPFIIMKATSYDRAFNGMREWEPTMIDDLATYFDLPPEAVDRSLLQDGFSDDLIKNKNVRVARYIPREADKRGIFDFFKADNDIPATDDFEEGLDIQENPSDTLSQRVLDTLMFPFRTEHVYAQDIGGVFISDSINKPKSATNTICYRANKVCIDLKTGIQLPGNTTPSTTVACYDSIFDPSNPDATGETFTPAEIQGQSGFICREVLSGGDAISDVSLLYKDLVCFDRFSGDRLPPVANNSSYQESSNRTCYIPYSCKRVACFKDGREVASSSEGEPGVTCSATNEVVEPEDDVRKSCVQFHDLLTAKNITSINLCFDQEGRFVPFSDRATDLEDYYMNYAGGSDASVQQLIETGGGGIQCISPQAINSRWCVTTSGDIVRGSKTLIDGTVVLVSENNPDIEFCFEQFNSGSLGDELNTSINEETRQKLAAVSQQLRALGDLASGFGFFPNNVSDTLYETADTLWDISLMNILDVEIVARVTEVTRILELLLNSIDPGAPDSKVVHDLREAIAFIKSVVGLEHNVAWVTIGIRLPQGLNIYSNGQVTGGSLTVDQTTDAISAVQQSLVLLGLMDALSVTGNLDLVTQQALQQLLGVNGFIDGNEGLSVDQIFISAEILQLIQQMVQGSSTLYDNGTNASINTYFTEFMGLGKYGEDVQQLQVLLYALGYDISSFNGIFDSELCFAVQKYQADNGLEVADSQDCVISDQTMESLNSAIQANNYLGSGFVVNSNGALEGTGVFIGTYGPGTINYEINEAEANSLREGDIVLMYTFLDEETILITRHESVITEVIRRRALSDIFNK